MPNIIFEPLLVSCPNESGGLFFVEGKSGFRLDTQRTTGINCSASGLFRGLQQNTFVQYYRGSSRNSLQSNDFEDIHDVLYFAGHFYIVSTERNEILKIAEDGSVKDRWCVEGEKDASHINCLGVWDERVVFSAFGHFTAHRAYKGCSAGAGFVKDLLTGETLISGLSQPHSLVRFGSNLLIANSEQREVVEYNSDGLRVRSVRFNGYVRGLCATSKAIYVGLSCSRNIDFEGVEQATVVALDPNTFAELGRVALASKEIYDIQPVPDQSAYLSIMASICHEQALAFQELSQESKEDLAKLNETITNKTLVIDTQAATLDGLSDRNRSLEIFQEDQRHKIAELEHAISALKKSRSWRITAPLRSIGIYARLVKNWLSTWKKSVALARMDSSMSETLPEPPVETLPEDLNDYQTWVERYDTLNQERLLRLSRMAKAFKKQPKISVLLPVYDPPIQYLEAAILSVQNQIYPHWELCIADDASTNPDVRKTLESYAAGDQRIKLVCRQENGHISAASNSALALASGDFVALLDHDDMLAPQSLFWVAEAINRFPDAGLIYSDEDKITESGERYDPYFKSALNYELLLAQNMISHLGVYRRDLLLSIGGFRQGFEGAQDYDLVLRVLEKLKPKQVVHIPRILYHWRAIPGSTATDVGEKEYAADAARNALTEHLQRTGRSGDVMPAPEVPNLHRVRYALPATEQLPLVSIIIPTRDRADLLRQCLASIQAKTTYKNHEILIVDNGSVEELTHQFFAEITTDQIRVLRDDSPFNYAKLNNNAVRHARGDVLCFMNNDIEIQSEDWIEEMLSFALQKNIGCVGARLWYPNHTLQHAGVVLGIGGAAGHAHKHFPKGHPGYFAKALLSQSYSAVTGACLMLRRSVWDLVGGFNEAFEVAFNDIDFCLRVQQAGYRNVWTPYAEMLHHESATRGYEDTTDKIIRFQKETERLNEIWSNALQEDFAYNPNLTMVHENFSLAWPPRNQSARINSINIRLES